MTVLAVPSERKETFNLFYLLIFFYFLTLSADVLHFEIFLFKAKLNNFLAATLFLVLLFSSRGIIFSKEITFPFFAILSSLIISACGSVYIERCLGYTLIYLFEFFCYFLVPFTLFFRFDPRKILKCYFFSFLAIGLYALSQLLLSMGGIYTPLLRQVIEVGGWARPHGLSYEPSFYALYMSVYVMFCNAFFLLSQEKKSLVKLFFINGLLLLSTSTSGFFAYGILIPLLFCFRSYAIAFKKKLFLLLSSLSFFILLLLALAPKMALFFFKFFTSTFFTHHSFAERWKGIVGAWSAFCDHPFLGVGIGGIGPYLFYRDHVGILPESTFGLTLQEAEYFDPTNVATEVLGGLGCLGVIAFFFLFKALWKSFKKALYFPEKERSIALSLFISLFVMLVLLQFNSGLFRCYVWVHMGITLGYSACLSSSSQPSATS